MKLIRPRLWTAAAAKALAASSIDHVAMADSRRTGRSRRPLRTRPFTWCGMTKLI